MDIEVWRHAEAEPPPEGELVMTRYQGGSIQTLMQPLRHQDGTWYPPGLQTQVFYQPGWWRPLTEQESENVRSVLTLCAGARPPEPEGDASEGA